MKSVSNLQLQHGRALELNSIDNSKTGSIRQDGSAVKITGASNGVAISAGHDLIFQGASANIGGLNSILTLGSQGDTIAMNATGATYMLPNVAGNMKIAGTLESASLKIGGTTIVGTDKKLDWGLLKNIPTSFTPATHTHDDRYYTETESDNRFLKLTGGTLTGPLTVDSVVKITAPTGIYIGQDVSIQAVQGNEHAELRIVDGATQGGILSRVSENSGSTWENVFEATKTAFTYRGNNVWHAGNFSPATKADSSNVFTKTESDERYQYSVIEVDCTTASTVAAKEITIPNYVLKGGDMFAVKFTLGTSVASPTLNVNGAGAKNVRLGSTNASTTTMTVGTNGVVVMYYDGVAFQLMGSHRTTDSTTDANMYHSVSKRMGASLYSYKLIAEGKDGKYYPLTLETGTGTSKTITTAELKLGGMILYYNTTTTVASGANVSNTYSEINTANLHYTFNQSGGYELYEGIYLVGQLTGNGGFILDNSTKTSFYTQTLPTSEDGKIYIYLGQIYATNSIRLSLSHPIYEFKDGQLRKYVPNHTHDISEIEELQATLDGKEPKFSKNTAFNKSFGKAAGTVAEGNHTHTWDQIGGKPAEYAPTPHDHDSVYVKKAGDDMTGALTFGNRFGWQYNPITDTLDLVVV